MKDLKTILLTTDLSDVSKKAVEATLTLARKFGAKVILTHVGEVFPLYPYYALNDSQQLSQAAHEQARNHLAEFAKANLGPGVEVELEVPLGTPHVEIVDVARRRKVDLIVMAPHGRGFVSHAIMGSTTERVLRRASCPVLVVREAEAA